MKKILDLISEEMKKAVALLDEVKESILEILEEEESAFVHGYMSNAGYEDVREAVAASLNRRFGTRFHKGNILMTVGAASGLNVILKTILDPGDEVVTFAPYFVEYGSYVRNYDGELRVVPPIPQISSRILRNLRSGSASGLRR